MEHGGARKRVRGAAGTAGADAEELQRFFVTGMIRSISGMNHQGEYWCVDHCVGPLGVGTLVVAPRPHPIRVSELSEVQAAELGPLLDRGVTVVDELLSPDQVYVSACGLTLVAIGPRPPCGPAGPRDLMAQRDGHRPCLQVAMFDHGEPPHAGEVEAFAERARQAFSRMNSSSPPCNPVEQP